MTSSTQIPADIWLCIAHFIPSKILRELYSLNSLFLSLALDERYKEANFLQINRKSIALLEHMRSPHICSRVRRLRVNPVWFNLEPNGKVSLRRIAENSISTVLGRLINITPKHSLGLRERRYLDALTTDIVAHFPNVTSFILVTRYSPHPESLPLFLSNSWNAFGSNLRRLTLNAPLADFSSLLPFPSQLQSLEELRLRFSTDMSSDDAEADTYILTRIISPFLRGVTHQLKTFNLMSSALGDHSMLFDALDHNSHLVSLSLNIGFYPPLLHDPSHLLRFLHNSHNSLKHVKLQPLETFRSPSTAGAAYNHFKRILIASADDDILLRNLETLVVLPATAMSHVSQLDAASIYIPRSRDTLTTLVLGERCISFTDLALLVSYFSHRPPDRGLKILHVKLLSLTPQVFDLLAEKLVGLDDLDMKFNVLLPAAEEQLHLIGPFEDQEPTEQVRRHEITIMPLAYSAEQLDVGDNCFFDGDVEAHLSMVEALFAVDLAEITHDDEDCTRDSDGVAAFASFGSGDTSHGPYTLLAYIVQLGRNKDFRNILRDVCANAFLSSQGPSERGVYIDICINLLTTYKRNPEVPDSFEQHTSDQQTMCYSFTAFFLLRVWHATQVSTVIGVSIVVKPCICHFLSLTLLKEIVIIRCKLSSLVAIS